MPKSIHIIKRISYAHFVNLYFFFLQNHLTFRDIANIKLMRYDEM